MKKPVKITLMIFVVLILTIGGFMIYRQTEAGQIAYHRAGFIATQTEYPRPKSPLDYFSREGIGWLRWHFLHERKWKFTSDRRDEMYRHLEALLVLGHLKKIGISIEEKYFLELASMLETERKKLLVLIQQKAIEPDFLIVLEINPDSRKFTIFATTEEMSRWQAVIDDFNRGQPDRDASDK